MIVVFRLTWLKIATLLGLAAALGFAIALRIY